VSQRIFPTTVFTHYILKFDWYLYKILTKLLHGKLAVTANKVEKWLASASDSILDKYLREMPPRV
tara:strand:+ start:205 stop:399 length:195 start_codon:yes stop_codon:yes gene_type:complete